MLLIIHCFIISLWLSTYFQEKETLLLVILVFSVSPFGSMTWWNQVRYINIVWVYILYWFNISLFLSRGHELNDGVFGWEMCPFCQNWSVLRNILANASFCLGCFDERSFLLVCLSCCCNKRYHIRNNHKQGKMLLRLIALIV